MADNDGPENGQTECDLSPELVERAARYAQENLEHRELIVENLQTTLAVSDPDIPQDEKLLLRFLRANEFKLFQTSNNIKSFYKYKANNPEMFKPLSGSDAEDIVNTGLIGVLPGRDLQGGKVIYIKIGLWDPERVPMAHMFRLAISLHLKLIQDIETQVGGLRTMVDLDGLEWMHARAISISEMRKFAKFYEDAFPARFEGIHKLNDAGMLDRISTLIRPFLSIRVKARTHHHGYDYDELYDYISPAELPPRYGADHTDEEIKDYTLSLLKNYHGDDFGGCGPKISKREDKLARDSVVTESTSGTYRSFDPS